MFYILLIIVIVLLILERYINSNKEMDEVINQDNTLKDVKTENSFYKKDYLLTQNELKFYKLLKPIVDKLELNLFCQVAMYEIINCKDLKSFNRIKSKSIDFVITEKNCKIKLCIELDDRTHNYNKRIKRDAFVNKIFEQTNTKLLRIKVENFYNLEELERKIKENLV